MWPCTFRLLKLSQSCPDALLGILANGTGIEQDQIRFVFIACGRESRITQNACNNLRIAKIHLTSVALQVELSRVRRLSRNDGWGALE